MSGNISILDFRFFIFLGNLSECKELLYAFRGSKEYKVVEMHPCRIVRRTPVYT